MEAKPVAQTIEPVRWRSNWASAMWLHLFWAVQGGELDDKD